MIPESNIAAGKCNRTIRRDNSVLQRDFKTHDFEFTKQDIDVLQRYTEVVEHSKMVGDNYLTFIFNKASSITSEFSKKDFLPWFKSIYIKAANEKNTEAHTVISANFVIQREVYYKGMGNRSVRIRDDLYRDSDIVNVFHVIDRSLLSSFFHGLEKPRVSQR